jgi:hypothetical protein
MLRSLFIVGVLASGVALTPAGARGQSVVGKGSAAVVRTPTSGPLTFASVTLLSGGGMQNADVDVASVPNALDANGLTSITTGQVDQTLVSATTSAEATDVNILNGLITAKAVLALATSYADGTTARNESSGSTLQGLAVNGASYADGAPTPNTRVELPGVGYVVLNEQTPTGDGVHNAGLTVNMIHVYLTDPVTGASIGNIVVGTAQSAASL